MMIFSLGACNRYNHHKVKITISFLLCTATCMSCSKEQRIVIYSISQSSTLIYLEDIIIILCMCSVPGVEMQLTINFLQFKLLFV